MPDALLLEARNLNKSYGRRRIINNLDIEIAKGDIYGFLGPNGAGKTTTIRMLLGLVRYNSGSIRINGFDIRRDFKKAIAGVGAVVETPRFYENYSGYDNLKMTRNLYRGVPRSRLDEVLEITGLSKRAGDKVKTYSLGMKQRLGIARALVNNPELVILDEPTNGLDPQGMKEVRELLLLLSREKGITFFISTHLLSEVELVCNKVGIINLGTKVVEGYVKDLLNSDHEIVEMHTSPCNSTIELVKNLKCVRSLDNSASLIKKDDTASRLKPAEDAGNLLTLKIDKGTSGEIVKLLVENGITVKYVVPKKQSLEDYFIGITEGGGQIA